MSYRPNRRARSWLRSFLYFVFSRCGRSIVRKIIPFCLCFVVLGLSLTVPSFAANTNGNMDFYASQASLSCYYYNSSSDTNVPLTPRTDLITYKGKEAFRIICPTADGIQGAGGYIRYVESFTLPQLHGNHEYTLDFWYAFNTASFAILGVQLEVVNGNGTVISTQDLYTSENVQNDTWTECNISFKPDLSQVQSGYTLRLVFRFVQTHNGNPWSVHISNYIYFNDNDDDTGLLNGILNWLSRIYHSIAGGTDREGVTHTGLVQGISNALTNLGNRISGFFADLKQGFLDKLESVKSSITNAIAGIQQWFIDLKDNIINGLKSLFIPSEGYFAQKKEELEQFMTEHFGAVWQGPGIMLDFVRALLTIEPSDNPQLVMPAIEFEFNGQTWHLSDPITYSFSWVNDTSHPLHYFYLFYMGFVTLILVILFINYLKRKFDIILGMREE